MFRPNPPLLVACAIASADANAACDGRSAHGPSARAVLAIDSTATDAIAVNKLFVVIDSPLRFEPGEARESRSVADADIKPQRRVEKIPCRRRKIRRQADKCRIPVCRIEKSLSSESPRRAPVVRRAWTGPAGVRVRAAARSIRGRG